MDGRRLDFNPLAPRGARLDVVSRVVSAMLFQSTRPSRGETDDPHYLVYDEDISIHSPLAGRDAGHDRRAGRMKDFNPLAPRGARQGTGLSTGNAPFISIHSPLAGRDTAAR